MFWMRHSFVLMLSLFDASFLCFDAFPSFLCLDASFLYSNVFWMFHSLFSTYLMLAMEADQREESSKIDEILENLQELNVRLKTVENKVDKVEEDRLDNITEDHQIDVNNPDRRGQHDQDDVNFHNRDRVSDTDNDLNVPVDLQAEFAVIKDAVSKVKLPSDHRLNDQKRGI